MAVPVLIVPADGAVPGLWNVEFTDGSWHELTTGQVQRSAVVGQCMAVCPRCRASRWYGYGPCTQCGGFIFGAGYHSWIGQGADKEDADE